MDKQPTIGNTTQITFIQVGKTVEAKVDTGATTSSLHATNITVDEGRGAVTFASDALSHGRITLNLAGVQEVHSADAGGVSRPVVELDVEVGGVTINGMKFNLNDRSNMDSSVLIGQNVLQAGGFLIDTTQQAGDTHAPGDTATTDKRDLAVSEALAVLAENDVTLAEVVKYLQTVAIANLKS